jgi:hypothetical protein
MALRAQRIRIFANRQTKRVRVDVLTDDTPHLLKPSDLQVEVALFDDDGETLSTDVGDLAELTLTIKAGDPRTGAALMEKTVVTVDLSPALTLENWRAGSPAHRHALFEFTAAETDLDLGGETEVSYYLLLTGIGTDDPATEIAIANGVIRIEESGAAGALAPVTGGSGALDPEGVVTANPGATYFNTAAETFWVKKTGVSNTGWRQLI